MRGEEGHPRAGRAVSCGRGRVRARWRGGRSDLGGDLRRPCARPCGARPREKSPRARFFSPETREREISLNAVSFFLFPPLAAAVAAAFFVSFSSQLADILIFFTSFGAYRVTSANGDDYPFPGSRHRLVFNFYSKHSKTRRINVKKARSTPETTAKLLE